MSYKYIVTHCGRCHLDELVAIAFALAIGFPPGALTLPLVYRRDPVLSELEDPEVLVLDVGRVCEPEKNNYDHHQRPRNLPPESAASLWLTHNAPGVLDLVYRFAPWFKTMVYIDVNGPDAWAASSGYSKFPFDLGGAIEAPFKALFEAYKGTTPVAPELVKLLWHMGQGHLAFLNKRQALFDDIDAKAEFIGVEGVPGVVYLSKDPSALNAWREAKVAEGLTMAFSITLDDRGEGFTLYRFSNDPRVDFQRLAGSPNVIFAHERGFMAKTRAGLTLDDAYALVARALTKPGRTG